MPVRRPRLVVLALALLALACGGHDADGGRAPGTVSSGLPSGAQLSELSDPQLEMLCHAFVRAVDEGLEGKLPELACTFTAIGQSIGVSASGQVRFDLAKCEQLVDACLADASGDAGAGSMLQSGLANVDCSSPAATQAQRGCAATVAQYERCYTAVVADFDALLMQASCEQGLTALDAGMPAPAMMPPPQCAELRETCPQISVPSSHATTGL